MIKWNINTIGKLIIGGDVIVVVIAVIQCDGPDTNRIV